MTLSKSERDDGWTEIDSRSAAFRAIVRELFEHRELMRLLVQRDLRVRYAQTVLGVAWALIQPVAVMAVLVLLLGRHPLARSSALPYWLVVLTGMVVWTFFSQALDYGANSLLANSALLTKSWVPRMALPIASSSSYLVDLAIAVMVLAVASAAHVEQWARFAILPFVLALLWLFTSALSSTLAAWTVIYRDVRHALRFVLQLLLFASPVVYPSSVVPDSLKHVYALNPIVGVIDTFRWVYTDKQFPAAALGLGLSVTLLCCLVSLSTYSRMQDRLADFA